MRVAYEQNKRHVPCPHSPQLVAMTWSGGLTRSPVGTQGRSKRGAQWAFQVSKWLSHCLPHLVRARAPSLADWAKFTSSGKIQRELERETQRERETKNLSLHFGQHIDLRASLSWGQMFSQAESGNPAAAGQVVLYPARWNQVAKLSPSLAKASAKCS